MGALAAGILVPLTEHPGSSLPEWPGPPWLAWVVFGALCVGGALLGTLAAPGQQGTTPPGQQGTTAPPGQFGTTAPPGHPGTPGAPHGNTGAPPGPAQPSSLRPPHIAPRRLRGREAELGGLASLLRKPRGRYAVICGVGGVGKTALAAALADLAGTEGHAVFWIRWRDPETLADDMVRAAIACGLPHDTVRAARAGEESLPDVVWRHLGRSSKWLVVVDNADDTSRMAPPAEPIAHYRGWLRPDGPGLLVVTSRENLANAVDGCGDHATAVRGWHTEGPLRGRIASAPLVRGKPLPGGATSVRPKTSFVAGGDRR